MNLMLYVTYISPVRKIKIMKNKRGDLEVKGNYIDISGIAQMDDFLKVSKKYPFSEICETYNFHIPKAKPNIHRILKLFIDASVKETKVVNVPLGKRTIIEGMLHIKVFYSAEIYSSKPYFVHIDVPIYTFLTLKNPIDVGILIEDAVIHKLDSRNLSISSLLLVYPKIEEVTFHEQCNIDGDKYDIDIYDMDKYHIDKDKSESHGVDYYKEDDTSINFHNHSDLELNVEYDMNSYISDEGYFEEEKEEKEYKADKEYKEDKEDKEEDCDCE